LPRAWVDDIVASCDPQAWSAERLRCLLPGARYRSKSYVDGSDGNAAVRPRRPRSIAVRRRRTAAG